MCFCQEEREKECMCVFANEAERERERKRERERERKREMGEVEMGAGEIRESRSCCFCCCYSAKHLNEQMCLVFLYVLVRQQSARFVTKIAPSRVAKWGDLCPPGLPNG